MSSATVGGAMAMDCGAGPSGRMLERPTMRQQGTGWRTAVRCTFSSRQRACPDRRHPVLQCSISQNGSASEVHMTQNLAGLPEAPPEQEARTKFVAETLLPTSQGKFRLRGYRHTMDNGRTFTEPSAIISGIVEGQEEVVVRVHDACFTSEVLGSLKCDCREQLGLALDYIQASPPGMVIYLQQEGRGIGLANKIAAYALQEKGLDTVDANRALGLPDDCREYTAVRHILDDLGVKSIRLMTNNPRKLSEISRLGITIVDRVACVVKAQQYNRGYLSAKQHRMEHLLSDEEELQGQFCYWDHDGEPSSAGIPLEPTTPVKDAGAVLAAVDRAASMDELTGGSREGGSSSSSSGNGGSSSGSVHG